MARMGFYRTDCESILSQIKHQEKHLKLKRRWLMGLPISKSESEQKQLREPKFLKYRSLRESLLREDDIFYETIKTHVEEAFGACASERGNHGVEDSMQLFDSPDITGVLDSCLDALTNKGLYLISMILTGGSVNFEKTRSNMKKVIRESLPKSCRNHNHNLGQKEIFTQLSQLLNDPKNFRENCLTFFTPTFEFHHAAATKLLDGLEDLPSQALLAMHRKLRGIQGGIPQLQRRRHGWRRDNLIDQVRKTSEIMLSKLGKGDELQEPLAKAMAVAALSLKLNAGCQNSSVTDFHQFSPAIKRLQNEIVKAIWLLQTKVRSPKLKTLKLLLDPNADVSNGCLRTAVKQMLTEYLFECGDMDGIPNSLLETLAIINRSSQSAICFPKEEIEEEVECILNVSAQTKQILWDSLPDYEFDQDFTDAYMEGLEESDDDDGYDDDDDDDGGGGGGGCGGGGGDDKNDSWQHEIKNSQSARSHSIDLDYPVESTGESMPVDSRPTTSAARGNGPSPCLAPNIMLYSDSVEKLEPEQFTTLFQESRFLNATINTDINQFQAYSVDKFGTSRTGGSSFPPVISPNGKLNGDSIERHEVKLEPGMDLGNPLAFFSSDFSSGDLKFMPSEQSTCRNQYLAIQDVCDETSMVAYNLIGRILEAFAQEQGLDLDSSDSLYLRGDYAIQEDAQVAKGNQNISEEDVGCPVIVRVVKELMPSLPKSGIEKLKELMGT